MKDGRKRDERVLGITKGERGDETLTAFRRREGERLFRRGREQ